jgi:hypothetical protein
MGEITKASVPSDQLNWISVDTALPAYATKVILHAARGEIVLGHRSKTDHQGEHFEGPYDSYKDSCEVKGVTHWLPLPSLKL